MNHNNINEKLLLNSEGLEMVLPKFSLSNLGKWKSLYLYQDKIYEYSNMDITCEYNDIDITGLLLCFSLCQISSFQLPESYGWFGFSCLDILDIRNSQFENCNYEIRDVECGRKGFLVKCNKILIRRLYTDRDDSCQLLWQNHHPE